MNSTSLCSLAGRYENPTPTWFLAPIDCLKIPALYSGMINRFFCLRRRRSAPGRRTWRSILLLPLLITTCQGSTGSVVCAGADQPLGGEPGAAAGGAVQAALLHGLPPGRGAAQPQGKRVLLVFFSVSVEQR
jgi:hypothetical protein